MFRKNIIMELSGSYDSCKNSIRKLIKDITQEIRKAKSFEIGNKYIDLSHLTFIDSNLSVIIYAYIKILISTKKITSDNKYIIIPPIAEPLYKHLNKNNFCSLWKGKVEEDSNNTIIKISENKNTTESIETIASCIYTKLADLLMAEDEINKFITYLGEVCANSFQHGETDNLYISGQFFPSRHELNLTFINFGKTFRQNIESLCTDGKYITWAFVEGNSSSNSWGYGMTYFMELLKKYDADVVIVSDNEIYSKENGIINDEVYSDLYLGGALMNIKFKLNEYNIIKRC